MSSGPIPTEKTSALTPNRRATRKCPHSCTNVTMLTRSANGATNSAADKRCKTAKMFGFMEFSPRPVQEQPRSASAADAVNDRGAPLTVDRQSATARRRTECAQGVADFAHPTPRDRPLGSCDGSARSPRNCRVNVDFWLQSGHIDKPLRLVNVDQVNTAASVVWASLGACPDSIQRDGAVKGMSGSGPELADLADLGGLAGFRRWRGRRRTDSALGRA